MNLACVEYENPWADLSYSERSIAVLLVFRVVLILLGKEKWVSYKMRSWR